MKRAKRTFSAPVLLVAAACLAFVPNAAADHVIADDCIIIGSTCIGFDCVNGESFGFDTLRLKENNLRIKFLDTSNAPFPTNDWQLTANSSSSGGLSKFSIDDVDASRTPFTIEAGAPSHSLYVDDGGRVGLGTNAPVVELHVKDGDSPTLRLEQDTSSGFAAQTWDIAGNETSFFVRDATNGSTLPFRIFPAAPSASLVVEGSTGDVGIGAGTNPSSALHVKRTNGSAQIFVEEGSGTAAQRVLLSLRNNGQLDYRLENTNASGATTQWEHSVRNNSNFVINAVGVSGTQFQLETNGNLTLSGTCADSGGPGCDYVFHPGYELETIEEHAEYMWENSHLPAIGPTPEGKTISLNVQKRHFGVLNELEKAHIYIDRLNERVKTKEHEIHELKERLAEVDGLKERVAQLEALLSQSGSSR